MAESLPDQLYRTIVKRTGAPFVIVDLQGTILDVSDRIATIVGWTPDQLVGRNMADFLDDADFELALAGMAEIHSDDLIDSSVPIILRVSGPDGEARQVEVAALPLQDAGGRGLVALRVRSWEAQHHLARFIRAMLGDVGLDDTLEALTCSLAASMEGVGASVHYGFNGESFAGVVGSWPAAARLPCTGGPWVGALTSKDIVEIAPVHEATQALGAVTGWLVPVKAKTGLPPAVLSIWRDRPDPPYIGHRRAFSQAIDHVELALLRCAEHERLVHLARHDSLTGVGNRSTFRDHLAAALAHGEKNLAVAFCDLDDFKRINDAYGHGVGDELLIEVTARIRSTLRAGDEIARIGGDEFTILWREIPDAAAADAAALRVLAVTDPPFTLGESRAPVGISIGYVLATPDATADSLLAAADAALYQSKRTGGRRATRMP